MNTDHIEKSIEIKAPVSRVWRALTDHNEFGQWFGVKLEVPFIPGKTTRGLLTHPDFPHNIEMAVQKMEPETYFSLTWHPLALDPKVDYSKETPTLVEFRLEKVPAGTRLTVKESGFDKIPAERRATAQEMHDGGWAEQMTRISNYVTKA
jgi:uncharacterized protein YndB with AHSA1/START domain